MASVAHPRDRRSVPDDPQSGWAAHIRYGTPQFGSLRWVLKWVITDLLPSSYCYRTNFSLKSADSLSATLLKHLMINYGEWPARGAMLCGQHKGR
jgi:hypothetical protein